MYIATLIAFGIYFSLLLSIGVYFYNKNKNESDFAVGNRSLNYWVTALSAQASDMSDWLFMGFPGLIYAAGLQEIWVAVGLVLFMFLTWHFIAERFRIETAKHNALTLASFFQNKFLKGSNTIRYITGIICIYFFVFYIAAGFIGLGKVFEAAFGLSYHYGLLIGFCVTILYTLLGGLLAIAWGDFFQGTFLLAMIMLVPYFTITQMGGLSQTYNILTTSYPNFMVWHLTNWLTAIIGICSWGIGTFGQPHILINFMSIDKPENIRKAKIVGLSWQITALTSAIFVAIAGKAFFVQPLLNREMVFIHLVQELFSPFFGGFILCAILAATISTINTQSLVTGSLLSHDLVQPLFKGTFPEKYKVILSRASLIAFPLISLAIAWNPTKNVLDSVLYAWSGLGASFAPLVLLSLYNKQINHSGVLAGLLAGSCTAIVWPHTGFELPTLVAGFIINGAITLGVSTLSKKRFT